MSSKTANQLEAIAAPPLGATIGGCYQLVRFLGAGGMGAVYEARDPDGNRVAVKVLLEAALRHEEGHFLERFEREADVMASLESPHVVKALEAGIDKPTGHPFMVMPLLVGLDLQGLIKRLGPIHPAVGVRIIRQACQALQVAHEAGVVHRDIKPGNLFLDHDGVGAITVRVLDFGVARFKADSKHLTSTGSLLGTPLYMSPEQVTDSKNVDVRADVWSLAITLYRALSGKVPYARSASLADLYIAIATTDVTPLQDVAPWVEPGLATVVHGALIRARDARCPSIKAFADGLAPFAGGSDELFADMLERVPDELRTHKAARAEIPTSWQRLPSEATRTETGTSVERAPDRLLGAMLAGRYKLLRRLGRGGMGAVYEAVGDDGDRYAVKVIDLESAGRKDSVRKRFVREARAATAIESEHVVRVVEADADADSEMPFIAMELLQGTDLGAHVERQGPLPPAIAARLFVQACRGLAAAHAAGFVHRDIKPANLFLHELPSGQVVLKICDFGIAKRLLSDETEQKTGALTRTGGVVGSPMFMSPEQARSARGVDHRTDIWSLGAALYQTLTGMPPWQNRDTVGELIVAICTEPLPHLQDVARWVPGGLADIVHRCMRRRPDDRFASVEEIEKALDAFAGGGAAVLLPELQPVTESERGSAADRAAPPDPGTMGSMGGSGTFQAVAAPPAQKPRWRMVVGASAAALVAAGAAVGLTVAGSGDRHDAGAAATGSAAPPSATATSTATTTFEAEVTILPADAKVTVRGESRELRDGRLQLRGPAGESFAVVVRAGERSVEREVVITRSGQAAPASIELGPPSAPVETATTAASATSRPAGAGPATARPTGAHPSSTPSATAAVPTATASSGVRPKDNW